MRLAVSEPRTGRPMSTPLTRRFEAIVFDWVGTAFPDRQSDATRVRRLVEEACAAGIELAIVSDSNLGDVDAQLLARPAGPGGLLLALNHGPEVFRVDRDGPRLVRPRTATAERGAGLTDPQVIDHNKHAELGFTDKSDSARSIMLDLWRNGIEPGQVLIVSAAVEDRSIPGGVVRLCGGAERFAAVLEDQIARRYSGELPLVNADPVWTLTIDDAGPLLARVHESLLTLADGSVGTRGSTLVSNPAEDPSVQLSGVYTGQGAETQLLAGPGWNAIEFADPVELSTRRVLDLRAGTLSQELVSGDAQVQALLLSSLAHPATTVLRVCGCGATLSEPSRLQPPPGVEHEDGVSDGNSWIRVVGSPGSIVAASHERVSDHGSNLEPRPWTLDRIACYEGAPVGVADERVALARLDEAREQGFDGLLSEHRRAWATRWEDADIRIDGDPELQLAVRLALFHLTASVAGEGEAAVGARGLSGSAYRGHVFWDSDVYVLPFLAATHPRAARAMLEYRVRRLPAALEAAHAAGRAGARFPWESAALGDDVTPVSVENRLGETDAIHTGQLEEHIVADVAWAAAHYIEWTGDEAFASGAGLELLVQTARWWASRIELDADGSAHIRGVMGPDEYHERVDDNAYTNVMARWNLRRAANADPGGALEQSERHRWLELADALVDGYNPSTGIYEQFVGFYELEPLLIAELAPQRPVAADMLLGHERILTTQVVKQPDALMLHYLLPDEVAAGSLERNLDYYEPRTAHGSTLSPGVHAALLARSGRLEHAVDLLRLTARIDLDDIGGVTAGGLHLAAMGSVWRTLAFGFAGLHPAGDALVIDPVIVPGWETLDLRVRFRGSRVRVSVHQGAIEASADPPIAALNPAGEHVQLGRAAQTFDLSSASKARPR